MRKGLTRRTFLGNAAIAGAASALRVTAAIAENPATGDAIEIDTKNLKVVVDPSTCRWSAQVKGTPMWINDVYFLPNGDPTGWKVSSAVNKTDDNELGSFVTVTLHGTKTGELDFDYQISVSKADNDILIGLGRTNNTGKSVRIHSMDYFLSSDARLGNTTDKWISLGTHSQNREYYDDLWAVSNLISPKMYEVNHVIRDAVTGNSLLMGHLTTTKGASRFEVTTDWEGGALNRMQVRGYCSYKVVMPTGKSFPGEKLLICFNTDALRAMEHQADLIAIAHDVRLKQRRPINVDDRQWVSHAYSRFEGWMSGGSRPGAMKFFAEHGLEDFYWGVGGEGQEGRIGVYGSGGSIHGIPYVAKYPKECFLPISTPRYEGEAVVDFSNPLTIKLEHDRAFEWASTDSNEIKWAEMDFADWWDKWPGQYDEYMSALETYRAACLPWRHAIDEKAPRRLVRSCMEPIDHSYGTVDICRISGDADRGYEVGASPLSPVKSSMLFGSAVLGAANRFFYNGRVYWNDCDGMHVYKYIAPDGKLFSYDQAKVVANFKALAGNTLLLSEALDVPYPEDRIELLKRISPPTMDVAYPVDLFIRKPAQVWNMPIQREFAKWNVLAVFNYTRKPQNIRIWNSIIAMLNVETGGEFTTDLDAARDLRLDPNKEYVVYEFWTKTLIGTFKGSFTTRAVAPYDCDVYCIVEKQNRPVLISTSRHIRQMAFDIKDLSYDGGRQILGGVSRAVAGDPYQLRIYVPDGYSAKRVELSGGLTATMETEANLLKVNYTASTGDDVRWRIFF